MNKLPHLTFTKKLLTVSLLLFTVLLSAQQAVPFTIRYQKNLKGDMTMIANNIVNRKTNSQSPNNAYNAVGTQSSNNDNLDMRYIDVDNDNSTFSSSTATLTYPSTIDPACTKIVYAGLYWSATYRYKIGNTNGTGTGTRDNDFNKIKLKLPTGNYIDITGEKIFDGFYNTSFVSNSPYACYADITDYVKNLGNPEGIYTVANVRSTEGDISGGVSGGWNIFFVYENPKLPGKYITSYDGFAGINSGLGTLDINYSGFNTLPAPFPVNAKLAAAALEGDNRITGDQLQFKGATAANFSALGNDLNPSNNFFNSSVTVDNVATIGRNPSSVNTLGYDSDIVSIKNINNEVLPNNSTAATLRLVSTGDTYFMFFNALSVEIIEPEIKLVKTVHDIAGNDIAGANVGLGDYLDYVIRFQNTGNDAGHNFVIDDILPINTSLIDVNLAEAPGVTYTSNPVTGQLHFTIPDVLVQIGKPVYIIKLRVRVATTCKELKNACSNFIQNQAFATYTGILNNIIISDSPSSVGLDNCGFGYQGPANFLVNVDSCVYDMDVLLCGAQATLTAAGGYASYQWTNASGAVIGNSQTLIVNTPGIYTVHDTPAAPCFNNIIEHFNVTLFGTNQDSPIIPFASTVAECPNNGELLPKIFLCGINDSKLLNLNISGATSIVWEKLNEASCPAITPEDCANKNISCTWAQQATGQNYNVTTAGQYRLVINYENGCFNRFYFNVYANLLDPHYEFKPLICNTPGSIRVTNLPDTYEFQLINHANGAIVYPYQNNPNFIINQAGSYDVVIRQIGVVGGCIYTIPQIGITNTPFTVTKIIKNATCNGLGSIRLQPANAAPQYYYSISGTSSNTSGPVIDNDYTFTGLNPGNYTITVTTADGCSYTDTAVITDYRNMSLTAAVSQSVSCVTGTIQLTATAGLPQYLYAIYSYNGILQNPASENYQNSAVFEIEPGQEGTYVFTVSDANNCSVLSNPVTISAQPNATYTPLVTNVSCFGAANGAIQYTIGNTNGYTLSYDLLDAAETVIASNTTGSFTNLAPGNYSIVMNQVRGTISCPVTANYTITQPLSALSGQAQIVQAYTCTTTGSIGIVTGSVQGGTTPYQYSIDGITFGNPSVFTGLTNGTYTIKIKDANGCTTETNAIVLVPLNPPTDLTFAKTALTCPALVSTVTVTVVGGNTPFTYAITAPTAVANGNNNVFTNLAAGTYTFKVTDAKGCTYSKDYFIASIVPIQVTGTVDNNVSCFTATDGAATFSVNGFATTYSYTINGGTAINNQTNPTIPLTNLAAGTHTIIVKDNNTQCTATAFVTITKPATALALTTTVTAIGCTANGSVTVNATGGWGGYTYQLTLPNATVVGYQNGAVFNTLTQTGTYTVKVKDANGCVATGTFALTAATAPTATISTGSDLCYDTTNQATIIVTATGGTTPYTYSINNATPVSTNSFLITTAGTYTIKVTGANGCSTTVTQVIAPALTIGVTAQNIPTCGTAATINVTTSGGSGTKQYAVQTLPSGTKTYSTTIPTSITGVGNYMVWVKDAVGCEASFSITITKNAPIVVTETHTNILCYGSTTGSITVTATGGSSVYTYSLNNTTVTGTNNSFTNLGAGTYTIRVKDSQNCIVTKIVTITQPPFSLTASAGISRDSSCDTTGGLTEVRITNAEGGVLPYTYSFNGTTYGNSNIGNLPVGTHTVYIKDANGCIYPMSVTINANLPAPVITTTVVPNCNGTSNITVNAGSTAFNYTYSLDGVPNVPPTSNVFNNVVAGPHNITTTYGAATPPTPSNLLLETFGAGANTSISNISSTYCFEPQDGTNPCGSDSMINDGEYCVTKKIQPAYGDWVVLPDHTGDLNGRMLVVNIGGVAGLGGVIYEKPINQIIPNQNVIVSLWGLNLMRSNTNKGKPDIVIQLVTAGGTVVQQLNTGQIPNNELWNNYVVSLNPGSNTSLKLVLRTNSTVTEGNDLAVDDIKVTQVPEICGTTIITPVVITNTAFTATITGSQNISCNGAADGAVTVQAQNFGPYFYSLDNGTTWIPAPTASPFTITGLPAGNNTILVKGTNADSCIKTLAQTLTQPNAIALAVTPTPKTCLVAGTVTALGTGGSGNYQYLLTYPNGTTVTGPQNSGLFTGLTIVGTYTVTVTDTNGCTTTKTFIISEPNAPVATISNSSDICYDADKASITIDVTGGVAPYTYSLNGQSPQNEATFSNLIPGLYTVTVKDSYGCTTTVSQTIAEQLTSGAILTKTLDCSPSSNASITVSVDGGTAPYKYQVSFNGADYGTLTAFTGSNFVYPALLAGTYTFQITDAKGCIIKTSTTTVPVLVLPVLNSVTQIKLILCAGGADAEIQLSYTASSAVTISVVNTTTGVNYGNQTSGLPKGTYLVTITDINSCPATKTITIAEPNPITYAHDEENIICDGVNEAIIKGKINITGVTGGTGQYTYHLYNDNGEILPSFGPTTATSHTFDILEFGIYKISVTDANGCVTVVPNIRIASPPNSLAITAVPGTVTCTEGNVKVMVGSAIISPGPFYFSIYSTNPVPTYPGPTYQPGTGDGGLSAIFEGLTPGVLYSFIVYDETTHCYYYQEAESAIPSLSSLVVSIPTPTNVSCVGNADGNVSFTFSNWSAGTTAVEYQIFKAQQNTPQSSVGSSNVSGTSVTVNNFATLAPGNYYIKFTQIGGPTSGCTSATGYFSIAQSTDPLIVKATITKNDNCNVKAGQITVTAQQGTAPYQYMVLPTGSTAPTLATWAGTTSSVFNADGGSYTAYVKDANNCIRAATPILLPTDPAPFISATVPNQCTAADTNFTIQVNRIANGIAPYNFSLDNGAPVTQSAATFTYTNLSSGSHSVTITDANGCGNTVNITVYPPLNGSAPTIVQPTCGENNGSISVTAIGGSLPPNYRYELQGPMTVPIGTASLFTGLAPGNYTVIISDLTTNCTTSISAVLNTPTPVTFTATPTAVSCAGGNDGTITVHLDTTVNDNPDYQYAIDGGSLQNNPFFSGLTAGSHSIKVTSGKNCTLTQTFTVPTPDPIVISPAAIALSGFQCATGNTVENAVITIDPTLITGGTGTYTIYEFSSGGTILQTGDNPHYISTNTAGGIILIKVYDTKSCLGTQTITIPGYNALISGSVVVTSAITCPTGETIRIDVQTSLANTTDLEYSIDGTTWQDSNVFSPLAIGSYTFTVRNKITGCILYVTHVVANPNTFDIRVTKINEVICAGTATGALTFAISDPVYNGPFNWEIFHSDTTTTGIAGTQANNGPTPIQYLPVGDYYVKITLNNTPYCSREEPFFIAAPALGPLTGAADFTAITCLGNDGTITISAEGGWGEYTYYAGTTTPVAADYTTATLWENLAPGNYQVWIQDQNGCAVKITDILLANPDPITGTLHIVQQNCTGIQGQLEVLNTAGGQGSNYSYQLVLDGTPVGDPQTETLFTNLGAGVYTVIISDQWNCTMPVGPVTFYEALGQTVTIVKPIQCGSVNPGGSVTIIPVGGSATIQYTVVYPDGTTTATNTDGVFTNLTQAGNYTFSVLDTVTNCTHSITQELEAPTPVLFTATPTAVSCFGGNNGSIAITLDPTSDNPDYTFSINGGTPQNNPLFTGLVAGIYDITVTSGKLCTLTQPITVTQPLELTATATATAFGCTTANSPTTSLLTIIAQEGTLPYTYSINGNAYFEFNTFTIADTDAQQTINVSVKDANGCIAVTTVSIDPLPVIYDSSVDQVTALTCTNDELVHITVTGGSGTFTYQLLPSGTPQPDPDFALTAPGNYTFQINDTVTGCHVTTLTYEVGIVNTINVTATATTAVTCFGANDGALSITVNDYTGPYDYTVTNANGQTINGSSTTGANPLLITGLAAGNNTVSVIATGTPYCSALSNTVTIGSPAEALSVALTATANVTCLNNQGGIVALASGGWGTYMYQLVNTTTGTTIQDYAANNNFTGLSAGQYTIAVRDAGNCTVTDTIELIQPTVIAASISASVTAVNCYGQADAVITAINVTGGQGTYSYILNTYDATATTIVSSSGIQNSPAFTGLGAGIYSITITDGWNCDITTPTQTITQPQPLVGNLSLTTSITCNNPAIITIAATGGTAPYQYSTDGTTYNGTVNYPVTAGTYQFYVKDANGCTAVLTNALTIDPVQPLLLNLDLSGAHINCFGGATATIASNATGGLGNYQYSLLDANNTVIAGPQALGFFSGLVAGNYYIAVNSGDCYAKSALIPITDPLPLTVVVPINTTDVTCHGLLDGTVTLEASGGTGIIQYAITPHLDQFVNNNVFTGLAPGNYQVIVQDQAGCFELLSITIGEPDELQAEVASVTQELCVNDGNGSITIAITGGTAPYSTSFNTPDNYIQDQLVFNNLTGGLGYFILIKDAHGCETGLFVTLDAPVEVIPSATIVYNCTNNVPGNMVTVSVNADVVNDVQYAMDGTDYQPGNTFANVAPGTHTIYVQHTNGCIKTTTIEVEEKLPVQATTTVTNATCNGTATGAIAITVTGGTGILQYGIAPDYIMSDNPVFENLAAGNYTVLIRDTIGCETSVNATVTEPDLLVTTLEAVTQELCTDDANATISVAITGGTAPYSTSLEAAGTYVPDQLTFNGLTGGQTYTVYVKDANNCLSQIDVTLDAAVTIQPVADITYHCTDNIPDNTVTITVNPAVVGAVTYALDGGNYQNSNVFNSVAVGNHTVQVQHTNGCIKTVSFTIEAKQPVQATAVVTPVTCNGASTGSIAVTATGGTGTLQYAIAPNYTFGTNPVFSNLPAGNYTVLVRDAIGCELSLNEVIGQPEILAITTTTIVQELCVGDANASFTIAITGGTAPYNTSLNEAGPFVAGQFTFANLTGGQTYTVYVKDANNCLAQIAVALNAAVAIQPVADITFQCTNNSPENTVTITVNPAVAGAVTYALDGGTYQNSNVFTNVAVGDHTVQVQHTNGCIKTVSFTIEAKQPVQATTVVTPVSCNGASTGSIAVTATGGTGTLQYAIAPNYTFGTNPVFSNLPAGNYTVLVRDAIGCELSLNEVIGQPETLVITTTTIVQELCVGALNASFTIAVSGGTAPYAASLNAAGPFVANQFTFENLAGGQSYTVYVRDGNNCITQAVVTFATAVAITPAAQVTYNCTDNLPGNSVTVTVNPIVVNDVQYSLDGITYQNSNQFVNLAVGPHTIYIRHTNGCVKTTTVIIVAKQPLQAVTTNTNIVCNGAATGSISIFATGGNGGVQYAISPAFNFGTTNVFTGLIAGTYVVKARDGIGCEKSITVTITETPALVVGIASVTQEVCIGTHNASVTLSATGGTAPYYTSQSPTGPFIPNLMTYNNLNGGQTYTFYIRDQRNCIIIPVTVTLDNPVDLQASLDLVYNCAVNAPGNTVTVHVNPAIAAAVQYSIDGGTFQSGNVFTNLSVGNHSIVVQHSNGCTKTLPVTIKVIQPIKYNTTQTQVTCAGLSNGKIVVAATGGEGVLQYGISPDYILTTNPVFDNLPAGNYTIRIEDQIGCFHLVNIVITEPNALEVNVLDLMQEICSGDANATIEIEVAEGTGPYSTSLNPNGPFVQDQFLFDGLAGGQQYTVYVKDANGCVTQMNVTLNQPITINAIPNVVYNCVDNTTTITVNQSVAGQVTYALDGGTFQATNVYQNLAPGNHSVEVVHAAGCSQTVPFTIIAVTPLTLSVSQTGLNQITAVATGGAGGYTYTFNEVDNGMNNVYVINHTALYVVIVTDRNGCQARAEIAMTFVDIEIPNFFTPNDDNHNDHWSPQNTQNYPNINTLIFDRYGRKIATLRQGQQWNGQYNGTPLPTGDYWYKITLGDGSDREFVGHFTIYR